MPFGVFDPSVDLLGAYAYDVLAKTIQSNGIINGARCFEMPVLGITLRIIGDECISSPSWRVRLNEAGKDNETTAREIDAILHEWLTIRPSLDGLRFRMIGTSDEHVPVRASRFIDESWAEPSVVVWLAHAAEACGIPKSPALQGALKEEWELLSDFRDVYRDAHVTYYTNLETPGEAGNISPENMHMIREFKGPEAVLRYEQVDRDIRIAAVEAVYPDHRGWPGPYKDSELALLCRASEEARHL
ncbi:hypothetical protein GC177_06415 [bacterium]|nr:hypothetical protein [bacterium]